MVERHIGQGGYVHVDDDDIGNAVVALHNVRRRIEEFKTALPGFERRLDELHALALERNRTLERLVLDMAVIIEEARRSTWSHRSPYTDEVVDGVLARAQKEVPPWAR